MDVSPFQRTQIILVIANLVNWLLHGVLTVQLYLYYLAFPNDRTWIKMAVYTVYILETIQVVSLSVTLLLIIVSNPEANARHILDSHQWSSEEYEWSQSLLIELFGGFVPLIAHCIYAHRIRIITQGKSIPCLIIALATLQLFAAILAATIAVKVSRMMVIGVFWTALNVVNDLIIASVMVRSLLKEQFLSSYTRSKVIRLVRLIIATGSLTVAANILALILLFIDAYVIGGWVASTGLGIFMPKVYANSILVMLNNRMTVRSSRDVTPLNMTSTNVLSTLVMADHQIGSSGSATSCAAAT